MKIDKLDLVLLLLIGVISGVFFALFQNKIDVKYLLLIILLFGFSVGGIKKILTKNKSKSKE